MTASLPAVPPLTTEEALAIVRRHVRDRVWVRLAERLLELEATRGAAKIEIHLNAALGRVKKAYLDLDEEFVS